MFKPFGLLRVPFSRRNRRLAMRLPRLIPRLLSLGALGYAGYELLLRKRMERWGALENEVHRVLPGDERVEHPKINVTHAITIDAPPEKVYPWLVQMGQGRGGLYTYTWLENALFKLNMHNADRIMPEFQNLKVGDPMPFAPNGFGPKVAALEPNKLMLLAGDSRVDELPSAIKLPAGEFMAMTWLFYLEPCEEGKTRLIERFRVDFSPTLANYVGWHMVVEPGAFVLEHGMLNGIKMRAEKLAKETRLTVTAPTAPAAI